MQFILLFKGCNLFSYLLSAWSWLLWRFDQVGVIWPYHVPWYMSWSSGISAESASTSRHGGVQCFVDASKKPSTVKNTDPEVAFKNHCCEKHRGIAFEAHQSEEHVGSLYHHSEEHIGSLLHVFHCDGFLLASMSASETATKRCTIRIRALSFGMASKLESLSQSFQGCFNSLGNFDIEHRIRKRARQRNITWHGNIIWAGN